MTNRLKILLAVWAAAAAAQGTSQSRLPAPTGEYQVGRTQFDWTDESRTDTENRSGHREIVVWVWYPASPKPGAEQAEWMPGQWGDVFWSIFVTDHPEAAKDEKEHPIHSIRTHAYTDASVASAQQRYPVLLFAPGLGGTPLDYSSLIEDVVSHGYMVAAIVPTYLARVSVFADGRIIEGRDIMAAQGGRGPTPRTAEKAFQRFQEVAGIWSNDLKFTLNQLAKVNEDARSPLKGHIDLTRIGAMGHSAGGAAVLQVAHDDARVRAVFDMDGSPIWNEANGALDKPVLVLSAASTAVDYGEVLSGAKPGRQLRLSGATHAFSKDFQLIPFLSHIANNSARGRPDEVSSIDPARALRITETYVEAFFDRYLKGKTAALLDGPSPAYPEIAFEQ